MKFVGFLITITIASIAFFVLAAVSVVSPFALKNNDDEEEEEEILLD